MMSFTIDVDGQEITLNPQPEPVEPIKVPSIKTYYKEVPIMKGIPISTSNINLRLKSGSESGRKLGEIISKIELLEDFGIDPNSKAAIRFILG